MNITPSNQSIPYSLSTNVIGLSGYLLQQSDTSNSLIITTPHYKIFIYNKGASGGFHLTQDTAAIYHDEKSSTLRFGIADGVSIVNNLTDNDSGQLSCELIKNILPTNSSEWETTIKSRTHNFIEQGLMGASTLVVGEIKLEETQDIITMYFITDESDTGVNDVIINQEIQPLKNESFGFIPYANKSDTYTIKLQENYSILLSTDGIMLSDHAKLQIIDVINENKEIQETEEKIKKLISPSHDDQTLIVITKTF